MLKLCSLLALMAVWCDLSIIIFAVFEAVTSIRRIKTLKKTCISVSTVCYPPLVGRNGKFELRPPGQDSVSAD